MKVPRILNVEELFALPGLSPGGRGQMLIITTKNARLKTKKFVLSLSLCRG